MTFACLKKGQEVTGQASYLKVRCRKLASFLEVGRVGLDGRLQISSHSYHDIHINLVSLLRMDSSLHSSWIATKENVYYSRVLMSRSRRFVGFGGTYRHPAPENASELEEISISWVSAAVKILQAPSRLSSQYHPPLF